LADFVALGEFGGGVEVGLVFAGVLEAFAEVGEAEDFGEASQVHGGEGWVQSGGGQLSGGLGGGVGEVEVELKAEDFAEGVEGGAEGWATEPAAENGRSGPSVGRRAGGGFTEGSKKNALGASGAGDGGHKLILLKEL
jgi:hypothetical protein